MFIAATAVLLIQPRAPDYDPHHDSTDDNSTNHSNYDADHYTDNSTDNSNYHRHYAVSHSDADHNLAYTHGNCPSEGLPQKCDLHHQQRRDG
ncbi:MAG: hypothetical protein ACP5H5_06815 [Pyrobaculum sp.]